VLRLVLPKGSLEKPTLALFDDADLAVRRSSDVDYKATVDDPRIDSVRILRPQEIPRYVAEGLFELGITGRDWIEETASEVVSLGELHYSKATARPVSIVVAVGRDDPARGVTDLPGGVRVATEYPELTRRFFEKHGIDADIRLSYGATEAKVPEIVDAVVELTETGRALKAAGLRIVDTILVSYTELIANPAAFEDPDKRHAMGQILTLLQGTLEARGKVLVKLNVSDADLDGVIEILPSMRAPTVSKLFRDAGYAVETVVPKSEINVLIPLLRDLTAAFKDVPQAFSVLDDGPRPSQVAAGPLPSTFQSVLTWTGASTQRRQSGHLDMAHNGVHVRLDAGNGPGYWFGSWQRPCPQSLLAPSVGRIPSSAACGLQARSEPLWEILVSPGYATVPIQPTRLRWARPATRTYTSRFVDDITVDGHPVWVSSATGKVRYPCRQRCDGWLRRIWTSIYFPERDAQVSILAPNYAGIAWLTDRIEVD